MPSNPLFSFLSRRYSWIQTTKTKGWALERKALKPSYVSGKPAKSFSLLDNRLDVDVSSRWIIVINCLSPHIPFQATGRSILPCHVSSCSYSRVYFMWIVWHGIHLKFLHCPCTPRFRFLDCEEYYGSEIGWSSMDELYWWEWTESLDIWGEERVSGWGETAGTPSLLDSSHHCTNRLANFLLFHILHFPLPMVGKLKDV